MYYSRDDRNQRFLRELRDYAHSTVGETLGNNRVEDEINIWLHEVLAHYPKNPGHVHVEYDPFIKENFTNNDPVELKRLLKGKHGK